MIEILVVVLGTFLVWFVGRCFEDWWRRNEQSEDREKAEFFRAWRSSGWTFIALSVVQIPLLCLVQPNEDFSEMALCMPFLITLASMCLFPSSHLFQSTSTKDEKELNYITHRLDSFVRPDRDWLTGAKVFLLRIEMTVLYFVTGILFINQIVSLKSIAVASAFTVFAVGLFVRSIETKTQWLENAAGQKPKHHRHETQRSTNKRTRESYRTTASEYVENMKKRRRQR